MAADPLTPAQIMRIEQLRQLGYNVVKQIGPVPHFGARPGAFELRIEQDGVHVASRTLPIDASTDDVLAPLTR